MSDREVSRSIPSLDGLRAIAVLMVILSHTGDRFIARIPGIRLVMDGSRGVDIFFVISGFLITHLLLKERQLFGQIDLKRFYYRRTLRIFPPFYVYLAIVACLSVAGYVHVTSEQLAVSASYTWNFWTKGNVWVLGHTWSLGVEEQFYVVWPFLVTRMRRLTAIRFALAVILIAPLVRVIGLRFGSALPIQGLDHTKPDVLMTGCLLALLVAEGGYERLKKNLLTPVLVVAAGLYLLLVHRQGLYLTAIGITMGNFCIAVVLLYSVFRHESLLGKVLNASLLRHLGRISYSLYLWNMLFTGEGPATMVWPLSWFAILIVAELSYFLVERPSLWARNYFEKKLFPAKSTAHAALSTSA